MDQETPISASLEFTLRLARAQATLVRRLDQVLGGYHGISFNDFMLLHYLNRAPGGRLRRVDLAERLALTASGVTRSLLPLEKIGLVERQQDPRDARVAYAALTDAGREMVGNAITVAEQISKDLLRSCPPALLDDLSNALGLIAGMHAANS
ncbi:DNA-binding transcriptional regulator, MarR family [Duganella sp. CF402]|uniref:MarR family winged helix-turn-helix transcriptional regulator n=1 Tax=unclassified Duganella TaxID=2636909 RepID=UPI0008BFBFDE|nr:MULTISPECIES: MarR family transcriptional regulator [unclassified Duganella]RZT11184.1 MarR family transcriptional regulator [Duganella sp. BK701]SEK77425.1 DNA-binding transcriptional regulator, MarR family [Duganella sp. CF402]